MIALRTVGRRSAATGVAIALAVAGIAARQQVSAVPQIDIDPLKRNLLCPVLPITRLSAEIQLIEDKNHAAIANLLKEIDGDLFKRVEAFRAGAKQLWPKEAIVITSAHRPRAYQEHLRELRDRWLEHSLVGNSSIPSCRPLFEKVEFELVNVHAITRCTEAGITGKKCLKGQPLVAAAGSSRHEDNPARAVDLSRPASKGVTLDDIARVAGQHGLKRVFAADVVHYQADPSKPAEDDLDRPSGPAAEPIQDADEELRTDTLTVVVRGGARLQVVTPAGERVGWDQAQGRAVNDIGPRGYHVRLADTLDVVDIALPAAGRYEVVLTGSARPDYALQFTHFTEHGRTLGGGASAGAVREGERAAATAIEIPPASGTPRALIVVPPRPLRLETTVTGGASPATSPTLRRWLDAAQVTHDGMSIPEISARINDDAVDPQTLFPYGATRVTFRATTVAGFAASAESVVFVDRARRLTAAKPNVPAPPEAAPGSPPDVPEVIPPSRKEPPPSRWGIWAALAVGVAVASGIAIRRRSIRQRSQSEG